MAKSTKSKSNAQVKSDLKKLKSKGLYKGDLRKPPTRYAKNLVKRKDMQQVLKGGAKVAKVPTQSAQTSLRKQGFSVKSGKVIVPSGDNQERVYVSRKTGNVVRRRDINGETLTLRNASGKERKGTYYLVTEHMTQKIGDRAQMRAFSETYQTKWPDVGAYIYHSDEDFEDDEQ